MKFEDLTPDSSPYHGEESNRSLLLTFQREMVYNECKLDREHRVGKAE